MNNYKVQILEDDFKISVDAESHSDAVKAYLAAFYGTTEYEYIEFSKASIVNMWVEWIAKPANQPAMVVYTKKL
jgi:hypothetical protein